jgi:2-methylcitrate dehydratase PrpD
MSAVGDLAGFAHGARFADLPAAVVDKAKRHILDTLGASLAGALAVEPRRALAALDRAGVAPAWGTGVKLGARDAALVNGIAAHALELDDSGGCDHSGAVVLPAALAALSVTDQPVSGAELLTAVVVGYDVARRVLEACGGYSAHNGAGWHSTSTCGPFGAAAAAVRLLGFDVAAMAAALGHAASFGGGLWAFVHDSAQTKRLHAGRAAEGGLLAALLAGQGISGPDGLFADVWGGFLRTFAPATAEPALLTQGFAEPWKIMRCSIKPYASCRGTHATIDAVSALLADHAGAEVETVEVSMSGFLMNMCGGRDLGSLSSAARLVHGAADIAAYRAERRRDPRIGPALARIRLSVDPDLADLHEPTVTITFADGRRATRHEPVALGAPANPIADAALEAKYRSLAGLVLSEDRVAALADMVMGLDRLADARRLLPLLGGAAEAGEVLR